MLLYRSVLAPACMLNADALHVLSAAMVLPLQLKFDFNIQCRQLLTLRYTAAFLQKRTCYSPVNPAIRRDV